MADTYSKLFRSITRSSVWQEPYPTRIVWVTFIAERNLAGEWFGSILGVAKSAGVTIDEAERAVHALEAPDRYSKTKDNEGRRIEPIPGGWRILNHALYNSAAESADPEKRKQYQREWDRAHRPSGHARQSDTSRTVSDYVRKGDEEGEGDTKKGSQDREGLDLFGTKASLSTNESLTDRKRRRIEAITRDAISSYNSILAKPNGVLSKVSATVGFETRCKQIAKVCETAGEMAATLFKSKRVTLEFWNSYFAEIAADDFKSGRRAPKKGTEHDNWKPTFAYLVRVTTMLDVYDKATTK